MHGGAGVRRSATKCTECHPCFRPRRAASRVLHSRRALGCISLSLHTHVRELSLPLCRAQSPTLLMCAHITYLLSASQVASFLGLQPEPRNSGEGELKGSQRGKKGTKGLSFGLTHATMKLSLLNQSSFDTINLEFILQVQHACMAAFVALLVLLVVIVHVHVPRLVLVLFLLCACPYVSDYDC